MSPLVIRVPIARLAAVILVLAVFATACSDGPATSDGELAAIPGTATPEPTAELAEILGTDSVDQANVVIAPTPTPDGPRPIVVATVLGETGVLAPLDGAAFEGLVVQIDELNDAGGLLGRPIELRRFDTNSRVSTAERIAGRLAENPPDLIVPSCDAQNAQPVLDMADANGLLTISPCGRDVRYLTGALGPRNFSLGAPAEAEGELAAALAFARYGSTAFVLRDRTSPEALEFCDGLERAFGELGGSVLYREEFSYDTLEPVQERLEGRQQPAFVAVCSHVPGEFDGAPAIVAMVRSVGFNSPIVGPSTLNRAGWFSLVPTLGELLYVGWSSIYGNDPSDRVNEIIRSSQQRERSDGDRLAAGSTTVLGADTISAWALAAERAGSVEPAAVTDQLASFRDEPLLTGAISFGSGARMDLGRDHRVLVVSNGELVVESVESTG